MNTLLNTTEEISLSEVEIMVRPPNSIYRELTQKSIEVANQSAIECENNTGMGEFINNMCRSHGRTCIPREQVVIAFIRAGYREGKAARIIDEWQFAGMVLRQKTTRGEMIIFNNTHFSGRSAEMCI